MTPLWIDRPEDLREALRDVPDRVGMDTEFVRERTWWPILALVQIALGERILLVDATVPGMPEALAELLHDESVLKIMHSPSEDLVAFGHTCHALPAPLFDTQAAAALCGMGAGLGYQKLVAEALEIALEKGEQRSDWLRRPLSASQCEYAADDVRHLHRLHELLAGKLAATGRGDWLQDDAERTLRNAADDRLDRWPHVGMRAAQDFDAASQARLLRLMRWREHTARARDMPKNWVIEPVLALQLAQRPPTDFDALRELLDATPKSPRKLARELWSALQTPLDDEAIMPPVRRDGDIDKTRLKKLQQAVADVAAEHHIPEGVLASRRWLESLLESGEWPDALHGWRRDLLAPRFASILA